tara:strand:+ start:96 stop:1490 length:1395 start_codon:yes stop_codon:yes gene_type:complete
MAIIFQTMVSVVALIVVLGVLVTIHEFGHYWVARRCKVKVLKFSIGFGRAIKSWRGKDGVEFVIAPIPLGGYVKMLGQEDTRLVQADEVPAAQEHASFASKSPFQRALIAVAGPAANFLLAIFVFWILILTYGKSVTAPIISGVEDRSAAALAGLREGDEILSVDNASTSTWQQVRMQMLSRLGETGYLLFTVRRLPADNVLTVRIPISSWMASDTEPNPLSELGISESKIPPIIGEVIEGEPAEIGGLRAGDTVLSVNGVEIGSWNEWRQEIRSNPELEIEVIVQRDDAESLLRILPKANRENGGVTYGTIGAVAQEAAQPVQKIRYGPITAMGEAVRDTWNRSVFILVVLKKIAFGELTYKNINGPGTIAKVAGETAILGLEVYLGFLALLSISLGVLNLLPIPVLDGGQILFCLVETVVGRPVPEKIQDWALKLGLLMVSSIMILAIYNDADAFIRFLFSE